METPDLSADLMIRQILSVPLTLRQQKELAARTPATFLEDQQAILRWLMSKCQTFNHYFRRFYENHRKLELWANIQTEKCREIEAYRFNRLLAKNYDFYQEQLQKNTTKIKRKRMKNRSSGNLTGKRLMEKTGLEELFFYEQQCAQRQKWQKNRFLRQKEPRRGRELDGPYEFYRKTFHACQGKRYISYDCKTFIKEDQKHMAAQKIKRTYRMPQRMRHLVREANQLDTGRVLTLKPEDLNSFKMQKQSRTLLISQEFHCRTMNQSPITLREGSSKKYKPKKIIVINHTGKPKSYKI